MSPVQREEIRINPLTPLHVMTMPYTCWYLWRAIHIEEFKWRLRFQTWGCVIYEGLFWEREKGGSIVWRAKPRLKGIEGVHLEHWAMDGRGLACNLWATKTLGIPTTWDSIIILVYWLAAAAVWCPHKQHQFISPLALSPPRWTPITYDNVPLRGR